ncbi:MAG: N-(5'-phosphoribosyl)anthranilate isomerase [Oligoflexales bacterium]
MDILERDRVWVKICGICDEESARFACEHGADAIGMVFAKSKRQLSYKRASKISLAIDHWPQVLKIGVFVNPSEQDLAEAFQNCSLDFAQLHGDESLEFCKSLQYPHIRALPVKSEAWILDEIKGHSKSGIILDTFAVDERGGSGKVFPWEIARKVTNLGYKVILAGGLNVENVSKAIKQSKAQGVDVSSGVETQGVKDLKKIKDFILAAKNI